MTLENQNWGRPADRGIGLGLAIAREVATAHGGRLWAEIAEGAVATFHLVLPRAGGAAGLDLAPDSGPWGAAMTLMMLVADDEPDVTTMLAYSAHLLWPGCRVLSAADGAEALRLFATKQPDLVVLDVAMPPPDGFAVCERLRAVSGVPILMLTAHSQTLDKVRAFDLGADDCLTKPFEALELLARLRALARRAELTPQKAEGAAYAAPPLVVGGLPLDPLTREAHVGERAVALTATEYRLLEELARHAGPRRSAPPKWQAHAAV